MCSRGRVSQCGGMGTRRNNGPGQPPSHTWTLPSCKETAPRKLYRGCPHPQGTLEFLLTVSSINTHLISHHLQDLRLSARYLPVLIERCLHRGQRFGGLPWQLAGSGMIVKGTGEILPWRTAGSDFTAGFYLSLSPLNAAGGEQWAEREGWVRITRGDAEAL